MLAACPGEACCFRLKTYTSKYIFRLLIRGLAYYIILVYNVPLRDVPRGEAQERIEKYSACDWYHTRMIPYYDVMKDYAYVLYYLWQHASHCSSRDLQAYTDRRVR